MPWKAWIHDPVRDGRRWGWDLYKKDDYSFPWEEGRKHLFYTSRRDKKAGQNADGRFSVIAGLGPAVPTGRLRRHLHRHRIGRHPCQMAPWEQERELETEALGYLNQRTGRPISLKLLEKTV